MTKKYKGKVFVGMSGGVDSSVSAVLLQQEGYEVIGVFMKVWQPDFLPCTWREERLDAIRVAAHLGIPLLTWDFEKEYKKWVMGYMFDEYEKGRTPNPDVLCNKWIKFGFWLERALSLGFTHFATGHYACLQKEIGNKKLEISKKFPVSNFQFRLLQAKDKNKDQAYFLHQLNQEQLQHTLFPIGGYTKPQVRALARKFKLPTAERAESMGVCFVGEIPMKEFLQNKINCFKWMKSSDN
jgi:tRNA-specific 2-thiouridylase